MRVFFVSLLFVLTASVCGAQTFKLPEKEPKPVERPVKNSFVMPQGTVPATEGTAQTDALSEQEINDTIRQQMAQTFPLPHQASSAPAPAPVASADAVKTESTAVKPKKKYVSVTTPQNTDAMSPAEKWLFEKGRDLLNALSEKDAAKRRDELLVLANTVLKPEETARLAMGRYWRELSDEQKNKYTELFVPYFVATYGSVRFPVDGVSFRIDSSRQSKSDLIINAKVAMSGDADVAARQELAKKGLDYSVAEGAFTDVFFAVRENENGFYIRDVQVMGKSAVSFLRERIAELYMAHGTAFLEEMQKNIDKENKRIALMGQFHKN